MPATIKKKKSNTVTRPKPKARPKPLQKKNARVFSHAEMSAFKNLRLLRAEHGMTQEKWADAIGVNKNYVRGYEAGRYFPSYGVMIMIADYCNVSLDWLFGRTPVRLIQR